MDQAIVMTLMHISERPYRKTRGWSGSTPDGGLIIQLYVDRWEWLIPLVTSYGADVLVEEPTELRHAITTHLTRALDAYEQAVFNKDSGPPLSASDYRAPPHPHPEPEYCREDTDAGHSIQTNAGAAAQNRSQSRGGLAPQRN
ncbi:WYL domain-containing protein [Nocardia sp. BMG51109]|uniref:WYL domain-containing protein n=1 Tax=Nocardia sp. BMG51109 TaxID=1056816 RepID=UPI000467346E|nr:WYL domain-containing protein [Nocardia sp. BMG51109]